MRQDNKNWKYDKVLLSEKIIYLNQSLNQRKTEYNKLSNKHYSDISHYNDYVNNFLVIFNEWKKAAIKYNFLLKECIRLGGLSNDNLNPILDLVQDVAIPIFNEFDKEAAGVPSQFDI